MSSLVQRLNNLWLREPPTPFLTRAEADPCLERMVVTLSRPMTVAGMVLSPGRYVLEGWKPQAANDLVMIFNEDQSKLIATLPTYEGPAI